MEKNISIDAEDIVKVGCFIGWQEDHTLYGGVYKEEAFEAFCRICKINPVITMQVVRCEYDK